MAKTKQVPEKIVMPSLSIRGNRTLVCICLTFAALTASVHAADSLSDLSGPWQLFVDDFLVAAKSGVVRTYNPFEKYAGNPIIEADQPWEGLNVYLYGTVLPTEDHAAYRMWYRIYSKSETASRSCYAISTDGINWTKPSLGIIPYYGSTDNNIYMLAAGPVSVMHTPFNADPNRLYTYLAFSGGGYRGAWSNDAIHWTDVPNNPLVPGGDVAHAAWDPLLGRYIGYFKLIADVNGEPCRSVGFSETTDFSSWPAPYLIMTPDDIDNRWVPPGTIQRTHFYGFCPFAYESQYIGFLWIFRATDVLGTNDGIIYVEVASSRDGIHWTREEGDRPPILPLGQEGEWDDSMVFTSTHPLKEGNILKLYYGGFNDTHAEPWSWEAKIGLATLRKDGFASLDAGPSEGTVTTRKLIGTVGELHVNANADGGSLKVEVLDQDGVVIPGYGRDDCTALQGDGVDQIVTWTAGQDLPVTLDPIRLRFILQDARLYSFNAGPDITVIDPLTISGHPIDCTVRVGETAAFSIQADGLGPLSYQWHKGGQDLVDDGRVTGATAQVLTILSTIPDDAGLYSCTVQSPFDSVLSQEALLTLYAPVDFDLDGDVDMEDFGYFQVCISGEFIPQNDPVCQRAKLDSDGDVDKQDMTIFVGCMSGSDILADASCAS